jgi:hypothetical protein
MSGCAGSSTDGFAVYLLCLPGRFRSARAGFFKYFAGQVRMDRAPGRIGFMSTQRRENRWRHIGCPEGAEVLGMAIPDPKAGRVRANASGGTAPPDLPARLATNSLQSGYGIVQLVQLVQFVQLVCLVQIVELVQLAQFVQFVRSDLRFSSPPFGAGVGAASGRPANHGSSLPHTPSPPGLSRLLLTLPCVPAG